MLHDGTVMPPVFKTFQQRLMVGATHPVFVVVDGHPVHKSTLVRQYLDNQGGMLQLLFLRPYLPQLNSDEYLYRDFKTQCGALIAAGQATGCS